jgi:hypothetical protein
MVIACDVILLTCESFDFGLEFLGEELSDFPRRGKEGDQTEWMYNSNTQMRPPQRMAWRLWYSSVVFLASLATFSSL